MNIVSWPWALLLFFLPLVVFDIKSVLMPRDYPGYTPDSISSAKGRGIHWAFFREPEPAVISDARVGLVHIYKLYGEEDGGWTIYATDENGSLYSEFRLVKEQESGARDRPVVVIFREVVGERNSVMYRVLDFAAVAPDSN